MPEPDPPAAPPDPLRSPSPAPPALTVSGLSHAYPDGTLALDGVAFSLPPGGRLALVGPNGSGKTTLLLHLNGLLLPSAGEVRIFGTALGPKTVRKARASVGLLFQDPDDQLFMPSLLEDAAFGPLNQGLAPAEAAARAADAIRSVGRAGKEARAPQALSGGEKRLAALAGLLAMRPGILALDEPTSGLDPRARRRLEEALRPLPQAILVASHDLEFCLRVCATAVVLDGGRVVREGPIREVLADRALMEAHGLERPHSLDHDLGAHRH
jgi:cobalt/nickel transport system ATP-binding protein